MRFHINLASQPYEDAAVFLRNWLLVLGAALLLTSVLLYSAVIGWTESRDVRQEVQRVRGHIAELDRERAQAVAVLEQPANSDVRRRSAFLNAQIARKTFSWTQVFSDLETLMPTRLQVVSIRPEITEDNRLEVQIVVAGPVRDRAVELVRRLEQSPRFRDPHVRVERARTAAGDTPDVQFEIVALYVPDVAAPPAPPTEARRRR